MHGIPCIRRGACRSKDLRLSCLGSAGLAIRQPDDTPTKEYQPILLTISSRQQSKTFYSFGGRPNIQTQTQQITIYQWCPGCERLPQGTIASGNHARGQQCVRDPEL